MFAKLVCNFDILKFLPCGRWRSDPVIMPLAPCGSVNWDSLCRRWLWYKRSNFRFPPSYRSEMLRFAMSALHEENDLQQVCRLCWLEMSWGWDMSDVGFDEDKHWSKIPTNLSGTRNLTVFQRLHSFSHENQNTPNRSLKYSSAWLFPLFSGDLSQTRTFQSHTRTSRKMRLWRLNSHPQYRFSASCLFVVFVCNTKSQFLSAAVASWYWFARVSASVHLGGKKHQFYSCSSDHRLESQWVQTP